MFKATRLQDLIGANGVDARAVRTVDGNQKQADDAAQAGFGDGLAGDGAAGLDLDRHPAGMDTNNKSLAKVR